MRLVFVILIVLAGTSGIFFAEARFGTTTYRIGDGDYAIPHRHEFSRRIAIAGLDAVPGLGQEPPGSVWLFLPAAELAGAIPGYNRYSRGYAGPFEADMIVNVVGDRSGRYFARLAARRWAYFNRALAEGVRRQRDPSGDERLVFSESPPEQGSRSFYLVSPRNTERPAERAPPSCEASPDRAGRETYDCSFLIHRSGLTFAFTLRQESIAVADRLPDYVSTRLAAWRR